MGTSGYFSDVPKYILYGVLDEQWLSAANQSRSMKAAIEYVGVSGYVAWMNLAKKHRMDLVEAMRAELIVNRERAHLPRCSTPGCGKPVKARGLCKAEYEAWLRAAPPEQKIQKSAYPPDDQIVDWYEEGLSTRQIAERIGIARESLRDYLQHHPQLAARVRPFLEYRLPAEEAERRNREAARRWRVNNLDAVREINRRWARNQDPAKRRRWNTYNRLRRLGQAVPLSAEQAAEAAVYTSIIRRDPCVYCGGPAGTVDHIRPINSAGADLWVNMAGACHSCNSQKNDKELLHYLLWRLDDAAARAGGGGSNPVDPDGR